MLGNVILSFGKNVKNVVDEGEDDEDDEDIVFEDVLFLLVIV